MQSRLPALLRNEDNLSWMNGFIPYDKESIHSVAQCLDFAVTDTSGAQLANLLGKKKITPFS